MNFLQKVTLGGDEKKNKKPDWEGTIEWKVPLNHERLALISEYGLDAMGEVRAKKGEDPERDKARRVLSEMPKLCALYAKVRGLIKAVKLAGPDGDSVSTIEEFETHPDLMSCVPIVALQYVNGFGPGKKTSQS